MVDGHFIAESPESVGLDPGKLEELLTRAEKEVREGLLASAQIAVARHGRVAALAAFGRAPHGGRDEAVREESLFVIYSATKAITSAAAWILIERGKLGLDERVADIVPEFGTNGKQSVRVEQLFTHTCGFPDAPYPQSEWNDRALRLERFASWHLSWQPGTRFVYHPTSSMWVLGELIERRSGLELRDFVREHISEPLGLSELHLGLARDQQSRVADVNHAGTELSESERIELGWPEIPENEVNETSLQGFNDPAVREAGAPGAGGIGGAAELALFYQALLGESNRGDAPNPWKPETLAMAREIRSGDLTDPAFGNRANRGLGIIVSGDRDRNKRGFGHTGSALTFGHNGAGGQIAWADPVSGISLAYLTSTHDRNRLRQGRRVVGISSRAATCAID